MRIGRKAVFISCSGAAVLALTGVVFGGRIGIDPSAVGIVFSAAVGCATVFFASVNWMHQFRNVQEPWLVTSREFHKEFWNDPVIARVRCWICCDEAYEMQLRDVVSKRLRGQVTTQEYEALEQLDRFFALMLRVKHLQVGPASTEQKSLVEGLGYQWWLDQALKRAEVSDYAYRKWPSVYDWIHPGESPPAKPDVLAIATNLPKSLPSRRNAEYPRQANASRINTSRP